MGIPRIVNVTVGSAVGGDWANAFGGKSIMSKPMLWESTTSVTWVSGILLGETGGVHWGANLSRNTLGSGIPLGTTGRLNFKQNLYTGTPMMMEIPRIGNCGGGHPFGNSLL